MIQQTQISVSDGVRQQEVLNLQSNKRTGGKVNLQYSYCISPLHTAVTADVIFPTHRVNPAIKCAHSHIATAVDHARCCSPLVVLRTELLDQAGWVLLGPSPNYQNNTALVIFLHFSKNHVSNLLVPFFMGILFHRTLRMEQYIHTSPIRLSFFD